MKKILITINAHYKTAKLSAQIDEMKLQLEKVGFSVEIATSDQFVFRETFDADGVLFWDKDILLAKRLEKSARVFNPSASIAICDDKAATFEALRDAGVAVPETYVAPFTYPNIPYSDFGFLIKAEKKLGYPMVIKRAKSSLGMGVYLVNDRADAETLVADTARSGERVLLEKFYAECSGTDVRIMVIGGAAVCAMKRVNRGDFRSNVELGGKGYYYQPSYAELKLAEEAARALNLDYAGVDVLQTRDGAKVIEVNSNAFFGELEKVSGVNVAEKYALYIKEKLETNGR